VTTPLGTTTGTPSLPGVTGTTGATGTTSSADSALGPDAFMKLLVAQLKYQNPMQPADGQSYMTQMATFTQVEKLDQLVKAQADAVQWQQRVSAENLVGKTVSATTDGATTTGTVTGVRWSKTGSVLELSGGGTLDVADVDHVQAASGSTTTAPPTTAPPTTTAPTATPAGTTAAPAGPPST
jgi:flagellar basal-body rod modification protein FlgD